MQRSCNSPELRKLFKKLSSHFISDRIYVRHVADPIKSAKTFIAHITPFFMIPGLYPAVHVHLTQTNRRKTVVLSQTHWATSHYLGGQFL